MRGGEGKRGERKRKGVAPLRKFLDPPVKIAKKYCPKFQPPRVGRTKLLQTTDGFAIAKTRTYSHVRVKTA